MHVVIVGAGYAGLRTAIDLDRLRTQHQLEQVRITLIDRLAYHQVIQVLHQTATGAEPPEHARYLLQELLARRTITRYEAEVSAVDLAGRQVILHDNQRVSYDRLVLALGAETAYGPVAGARNHSFPLRSAADAERLYQHIRAQYRRAAASSDPVEQRVALTFAVVGGGYTGVQLAGELAHQSALLAREAGLTRNDTRIALIDREPRLLRQMGEWAGREAERVLDRMGIDVLLSTSIAEVEAEKIRLADRRVLRAGTIVWAAGVRAPALLREIGLTTDAGGRAQVNDRLQTVGHPEVYALGDCAAIAEGNGTVPATASYAMRQGAQLAENLIAELLGKATEAYVPLHLGELVSIGPDYALGLAMGVPVTGAPAHVLKKGVEQYYRSTIELP
jgi:NADH:ubiquinone reductase (H+-translocating)